MSVLAKKLQAPSAATPSGNNPPFQKVALLLHGDGTNGAQNNTFVDSSSNNFTITRTGNVSQGTFSPFSLPEGQWSNYFDGSGDYLTTPTVTALQMDADFTWEAWVYPISNPSAGGYKTFWAQRATEPQFGGPCVVLDSAGNYLLFIANAIATAWSVSGFDTGLDVSLNQWQHIALVKNGTTVTLYKNGIAGTSATHSTAVGTSGNTSIMSGSANGVQTVDGYMSNFRVVKGTAVYTTNFTPSTSPLTAITNTSLLTCQSNRFKDNSSNNFTITPTGDAKVTAFSPFAPSAAYSASTNGGSGYFDGTGDYLTLPNDTAFDFGSGNFTVEGWFYCPSNVTSTKMIAGSWDGSSTLSWYLIVLATNRIGFEFTTNGSYSSVFSVLSPTNAVTPATWNHFAIVRNGTSFVIYLNGVSVASGTSSNTIYSYPQATKIGGNTNNQWFNGYLSNVRIVKGTAVYTANFTPPTAPLTAVTNTQLLLNCTNAGIIDNAGKNDIETVGNAQISTSVKKFGTGSMYFDGTGDYLVSPTNDIFNFGTGDFTVEGWINTASLASEQGIFDCTPLGGSGSRLSSFVLVLATSGSLRYFSSNAYSASTSNTITTNSWFHFAMVRASGVIRIYINGTQGLSVSNTTAFTASGCVIGRYSDTTSGYLNGYIDDLRITKGQALYTTNFTPPTQAFPNV